VKTRHLFVCESGVQSCFHLFVHLSQAPEQVLNRHYFSPFSEMTASGSVQLQGRTDFILARTVLIFPNIC
jgi:hypothetical protein